MTAFFSAARRSTALGLSGALVLGAFATSATAAPPSPPDDLRVGTARPAPVDEAPTTVPSTKARRGDKLGQRDRVALAEAKATGRKSVTILVATDRGAAPAIAADLTDLGGSVRYRDDKVGYVRAVVPTGAVERTARLRGVYGVDLNESYSVPDPRPARAGATAEAGAAAVAPPGSGTPLANPYLPINETGAAAFQRQHPTWDGRGVTVGVLDTGVDLDHPSLRQTSQGERKIVDWVTATDPLLDGDRSWRPMLTEVTGPSFTFGGQTWTSPAGTFLVNVFAEDATAGSEFEGDVNRDGDDTDTWGVLYRASDNAIWVDVDRDGDFTDEELRRPYAENFQVGHFGIDRPSTPVAESVPFVVEYREDVDLTPAGLPGRKVDFVNIGIVSDSHGSHVAGIAAGNSLFGGEMNGAAPGARIVSARGCLFEGGCTSAALTEGMIDLVARRNVDVVNMSIGGLPALNDGNNTRAEVYNRLIADYGVQIFLSAGNEGPGLNTVGDPAVVTDAVSVAATVSRATYLANYGARVSARHQLFNFSSRGPAEDGAVKPDLSAPGAAVSTTPLWLEGTPVPEAGYPLPPGYSMFNGTSMSAPQTAGGAALLLSAGRARDIAVTPAQLRAALLSSATFDPALPAYGQGAGQLHVVRAWALLRGDDLAPGRYDISAGSCTPLSQFLIPPNRGPGIYNRCPAAAGGVAVGRAKTYEVKITRRSGATGSRVHRLRWLGNDGTFSAPRTVGLPLGTPVVVKVKVSAATAGAHSAILRIDDPSTLGTDRLMAATVVVADALTEPSYAWSVSGRVERNRTQRYFVTVPAGAEALRVNLSGIAAGSQTRFLAFHPYGVGLEDNGSPNCYTNFSDVEECNPRSRTYAKPTPGVWEITVEARRTTPFLRNPFSLSAVVQGVSVRPEVVQVESATIGEPVPLSWSLVNSFSPVTVRPRGGALGSAFTARPSIATGETDTYTVAVPAGATRLDVAISKPSDLGADLDLTVLLDGVVVGQSADGDSDESVSLEDPAAGTYTVQVDGFDVPTGTTEYDYRDVFYAGALGTLDVPGAPITLAAGGTATLSGSVTPGAVPAAGRQLFGDLTLTEPGGAVVGQGGVLVRRVVAP